MDWKPIAEELRAKGISWTQLPVELHKVTGLTIGKETIRGALRRLPSYKGQIEYEDKKPAPDNSDIMAFYRALKEYNAALDTMDTKQTRTVIKINDNKPIAIAFSGDWHIGSRGVDYDQFDADRDLIIKTDGLYMIGMGDYKDNNLPTVHPSSMFEQTVTPGMQDALVVEFVRQLKDKILALTRGCHDDWDKRVGDKDFVANLCHIADCVNLWHGGGINIKLGEQHYKIRARHKYQGESGLNTTNAQRRLLDAFGPCDVIAIAHKHFPDLQKLDRMEQKVTYLRSGAYKVYDEFGQKIGGYKGKVGVPVVVLFPDSHKVVAFDDLRDGVSFLDAVRR